MPQSYKFVTDLNGHSGCKVQLIKKNKYFFVRKISSNLNYNDRLRIQLNKQNSFNDTVFKSPQIYNDGYIDGLYYYDMEFINGMTFNTYISKKPFNNSIYVFNLLLSFIQKNLKSTQNNYVNEIRNKIDSIKIDFFYPQVNLNEHNTILSNGFCHGDMTFENIIISKEKIYFIDFLDSYIESPIIDLTKIRQDLKLNWSNRFKKSDPLILIKNEKLLNILEDFIQNNNLFVNSLNLQFQITLLRILPYTKCPIMQLKILENI